MNDNGNFPITPPPNGSGNLKKIFWGLVIIGLLAAGAIALYYLWK
jgi:hypothetical protein